MYRGRSIWSTSSGDPRMCRRTSTTSSRRHHARSGCNSVFGTTPRRRGCSQPASMSSRTAVSWWSCSDSDGSRFGCPISVRSLSYLSRSRHAWIAHTTSATTSRAQRRPCRCTSAPPGELPLNSSLRQRVFAVHQPPGLFLGHQFYFGTEGQRQVGDFVPRRKVRQNRYIEIGEQVCQEVLELILL